MSTTALKKRMNGKIQGQTDPVENGATVPETALTTVSDSDYIALKSDALGIINENLKNQQLSPALFDVVKSPSGGATVFAVPGLTGEEAEKELVGIVLDYTTPRAYWDTPDPVEGQAPNCWSRDSVISHEGNACAQCQFNDFGSKNGGETNAKACKEQVALYLLRPDNIMPIIVRVPVTSKLLFFKYTTRLTGSLIPLCGVVTKITLEKAVSKTGKPYALYNFEAVRQLSPEETATARVFGQKFMDIMNAADVSVIAEAE